MFKQIVALSLILAIASAATMEGNYTRGELANFTQGFNDKLSVETADDFAKCVTIPIIPDVHKLYLDMNATKPNPLALVADVMALYGDYNNAKKICPEMAQNYEKFFANFTDAVQHDTKKTLLKVGTNIANNYTDIEGFVTQGLQAFGNQDFYGAGSDLGTVIELALKGFI